jgi:hypothetical protein
MPKRPYVKLTQRQLARKATVREANRESADTGRGVDDILEEWGEPPRGRKWDLIRSGYYEFYESYWAAFLRELRPPQ